MAITYDVVYKNNRRIPITGPCFGGFSEEGSFPSSSIRRSYATSRGLTMDEMRQLHRTPQDARFFQFYGEVNSEFWKEKTRDTAEICARRYYEEMKLLVADIPWMDASVHPLLGVIRIPVKDKPADQVMMTLFLMRNLAHYEYATGYRYLRKMGMRPYAAAIFSSFWKKGLGNTFTAGTWFYTTVGEYNWLSPFTFGRESLRALLTADETFNPWFQGLWGEQGGYRRDRYFNGMGDGPVEYFNPSLDSRDRPRVLSNTTNPSHYRRLIDCLSVKNDTPMFSIVKARHEYTDRGNTYISLRWGPSSEYERNKNFTEAELMPTIEEFIALCREFGYEPMMSE